MNHRNPTQDLLDKYEIKPPPCGAYAPEGWLPMIEKLIQDLIALGWDKDCHQVKEKFGGLRFYIGERTPEIRARIDEAEGASFEVCSVCGAPAKRASTERGWVYAACPEHIKK